MESPRAIVLDPKVGMLFWTDWDSQKPRIESCSLSGAGRRVIVDVGQDVTEGGWPNGLTLDYDNQRLYWIDARSDSIHAVDYFGRDHHEILRGHDYLMHPFAISLYGNHVYWTDWHMNWLLRANKWNGSDVHVVWTTTRAQPFDIQIFHPSRQPASPNPCRLARCSHLCLLTFEGGYACRCPHLMKLDPKNSSLCVDHRVALLISRQTEIRGLDLDEPEKNFIPSITVSKVQNASVVDYDGRDGLLYWTDLAQGVINRASVNGSGLTPIIDSDIPNPYGFAIDWVGRNMFFSSYQATLEETPPDPAEPTQPAQNDDDDAAASPAAAARKTTRRKWVYSEAKIQVAKLDGAFRVTVVDTSLVRPASLVVHPFRGQLFWSDHGAENDDPKIEVASMDGSQRQTLSDHFASSSAASRVQSPVSLSIDFPADRLFWINRDRLGASESEGQPGSLASCALDGTDLRIVGVEMAADPFALALYHGQILYSSLASAQIIQLRPAANASAPGEMTATVLRAQTENVRSMLVFDQASRDADGHAEASPCARDNGGCSQLCLAVSATERTCKCTSGYKLNLGRFLLKSYRKRFPLLFPFPLFPFPRRTHRFLLPLCACPDGMVCQGITSFLMYSVDTEIRGITLDAAGKLPDAGVADALSSLATISHIKMAVAIDFYAGRSRTTCTYTHTRHTP